MVFAINIVVQGMISFYVALLYKFDLSLSRYSDMDSYSQLKFASDAAIDALSDIHRSIVEEMQSILEQKRILLYKRNIEIIKPYKPLFPSIKTLGFDDTSLIPKTPLLEKYNKELSASKKQYKEWLADRICIDQVINGLSDIRDGRKHNFTVKWGSTMIVVETIDDLFRCFSDFWLDSSIQDRIQKDIVNKYARTTITDKDIREFSVMMQYQSFCNLCYGDFFKPLLREWETQINEWLDPDVVELTYKLLIDLADNYIQKYKDLLDSLIQDDKLDDKDYRDFDRYLINFESYKDETIERLDKDMKYAWSIQKLFWPLVSICNSLHDAAMTGKPITFLGRQYSDSDDIFDLCKFFVKHLDYKKTGKYSDFMKRMREYLDSYK